MGCRGPQPQEDPHTTWPTTLSSQTTTRRSGAAGRCVRSFCSKGWVTLLTCFQDGPPPRHHVTTLALLAACQWASTVSCHVSATHAHDVAKALMAVMCC